MTNFTPQHTFFLFGGFSLLGAGYVLIFMKETSGLSDAQKKVLYRPKPILPIAETISQPPAIIELAINEQTICD